MMLMLNDERLGRWQFHVPQTAIWAAYNGAERRRRHKPVAVRRSSGVRDECRFSEDGGKGGDGGDEQCLALGELGTFAVVAMLIASGQWVIGFVVVKTGDGISLALSPPSLLLVDRGA